MRTLRTIGIVSSAAALLLSASVAFANEGELNAAVRVNVSDKNPSGMDRAKVNTTTRADIEKVRANANMRVKTMREDSQKRLGDIQNKVKQELAVRLAPQFDNLNSTWTDNFIKLLDHYDAILVRIQARATIAGTAGKDIASTTVAIQSAQTAIANARAAVGVQAAKTYTLDTSTFTVTATSSPSGQQKIMENLRMWFKNLNSGLFKDLFALRDGPMKDARRAVQDAIQTLGKIPRVDEDTATSTAKKSDR